MMMGYGFEGPLGWLSIGIGMIVHLAFVAVIILSAVWLFKAVFPAKSSKVIPDSLEFLKQRYAKGEMNSEEYHRMKQELE